MPSRVCVSPSPPTEGTQDPELPTQAARALGCALLARRRLFVQGGGWNLELEDARKCTRPPEVRLSWGREGSRLGTVHRFPALISEESKF